MALTVYASRYHRTCWNLQRHSATIFGSFRLRYRRRQRLPVPAWLPRIASPTVATLWACHLERCKKTRQSTLPLLPAVHKHLILEGVIKTQLDNFNKNQYKTKRNQKNPKILGPKASVWERFAEERRLEMMISGANKHPGPMNTLDQWTPWTMHLSPTCNSYLSQEWGSYSCWNINELLRQIWGDVSIIVKKELNVTANCTAVLLYPGPVLIMWWKGLGKINCNIRLCWQR